MSEFGKINPDELDRHITGNYGEDQFADQYSTLVVSLTVSNEKGEVVYGIVSAGLDGWESVSERLRQLADELDDGEPEFVYEEGDDWTPPDYGPPGSGAIITEYTGFEPGLEDPEW